MDTGALHIINMHYKNVKIKAWKTFVESACFRIYRREIKFGCEYIKNLFEIKNEGILKQ